MSIPVTGDSFYRPGPCQPYDPLFTLCPLPAGSEAVSGAALDAASELLFYATAQRFDECQTTLRPCREDCYGSARPYDIYGNVGWPTPVNINGQWYNLTCGSCGDNCSCTSISEITLPGPVRSITQVTVDGVILTADTDYRLDNYRKLVRLGGIWPLCNDLNKDISQPGTWSVTASYGEPLPMMGRLAVGQLTAEIAKDLICGECALPEGVTNLTRQGVSMTLESAAELRDADLFGLRYVDRFIRTYNPHKLMGRAAVFDLDGPPSRVTGTVIT